MPQDILLIGADDVQRAATSLRGAATEMQAAAGTIDHALREHRVWMDTWLQEFRALLEEDRDARR